MKFGHFEYPKAKVSKEHEIWVREAVIRPPYTRFVLSGSPHSWVDDICQHLIAGERYAVTI